MKFSKGKRLVSFMLCSCLLGTQISPNVTGFLLKTKAESSCMEQLSTQLPCELTTESVVFYQQSITNDLTEALPQTTEIITTENAVATTQLTTTDSSSSTEQPQDVSAKAKFVDITQLTYSANQVQAGSVLKLQATGTIQAERLQDKKVICTFRCLADNSEYTIETVYNAASNCLEGEWTIAKDMPKGTYALSSVQMIDTLTGATYRYAIENATLPSFEKTDEAASADPVIEQLTLSAESISLKVNAKRTLVATILPEQAAANELVWKSADSSIATVDNTGTVTAKKEGTTTITVSSKENKDIKAECKVKVAADLVIVLDPGHGNKDYGAVNYSKRLYERDVNLEIAKACRNYLEQYEGVAVFLTRETNSQFLGLEERTKFAKECNADVFISLHNNASVSKRATGAEVWVTRSTYKAKYNKAMTSLGKKIVNQLGRLGIGKRGVFTRKSSHLKYSFDGSRADYYAVIRGSIERDIPAMIVEHAYIDSSDYRFMNSKAKTKKLGIADAKAIVEYYGLTKRTDTASNIEVAGIKLNCNNTYLSMKKNKSYTLKATIAPTNAADKSVTYTSSNKNVVSVSANGKLKAKKKGSATITCQAKDSGGMTRKLTVKVN